MGGGERCFPPCDSLAGCRMWCMRHKQHTTSCDPGNSLFTAGGVEDILGPRTSRAGAFSLSPPALIYCPEYLRTPHILWSPSGTGPGQSGISGPLGPGLFKILDTDFREHFFYALGCIGPKCSLCVMRRIQLRGYDGFVGRIGRRGLTA